MGGAIGDALGWPVEFFKYKDIINKFGHKGIQDLVYSNSKKLKLLMILK